MKRSSAASWVTWIEIYSDALDGESFPSVFTSVVQLLILLICATGNFLAAINEAHTRTHTHAHVFLHDKFLSSQNGVTLCAEPSSACYVPVSDLVFGLRSHLHSDRSCFIFNSVISCTACIKSLASVQRASQRKNSNLACILWFLGDGGSYISYAVYSFLQFNTVVNFQLT